MEHSHLLIWIANFYFTSQVCLFVCLFGSVTQWIHQIIIRLKRSKCRDVGMFFRHFTYHFGWEVNEFVSFVNTTEVKALKWLYAHSMSATEATVVVR